MGQSLNGSSAMMTPGWTMWKRRASLATAALAGISLLVTSLWMASMNWRQPTPEPPAPQSRPSHVEGLARMLGVSPKAMAAAGCSAADVSEFFSSLAGLSDSTITSIRQAESAAGNDTGQRTARRQAVLDEAFGRAAAGISAGARQRLTIIRQNTRSGIPMEFAILERSEGDQVALREALAVQRIASRTGEPVSSRASAVLLIANSNSDVVAAREAVSTRLAATEQAWSQAIRTVSQTR